MIAPRTAPHVPDLVKEGISGYVYRSLSDRQCALNVSGRTVAVHFVPHFCPPCRPHTVIRVSCGVHCHGNDSESIQCSLTSPPKPSGKTPASGNPRCVMLLARFEDWSFLSLVLSKYSSSFMQDSTPLFRNAGIKNV